MTTTEDPIRAWHERRGEPRKPLGKAPEEETQDPPNVESLTAGAEPQAPPKRTMDDYIRTGEDWGTFTA